MVERFLAYSEKHRLQAWSAAGCMILLIAYLDWRFFENISIGFLYILPILLIAGSLRHYQIFILATGCAFLREAFNPLNGEPGVAARIAVASGAFALAGMFVRELNEKRRLVMRHLVDLEEQMLLRAEAEHQLKVLIETSPLAIFTLDRNGTILIVNQSAKQLLGIEGDGLEREDIRPFLPTLDHLLVGPDSSGTFRTTIECKGQRKNGEIFLAHVWVSTYPTMSGRRLAAVVWDASENLRDREGTGLDSMMSTSRILIGAMSHEIRNLASAALSALDGLSGVAKVETTPQFQALASIIRGLEKIASSGVRLASKRTSVVADLGIVLDEARVVIEAPIREIGGGIHWNIARDLPLVQADHYSLLQVFLNLARNSQRAIEETVTKDIDVEAALEDNMVVVKFRDSGPGITRPDQLFRPFQPGAHSDGLGLFISRAILRSDGGDLRYEPQQQGSCFVIELWPVGNERTND